MKKVAAYLLKDGVAVDLRGIKGGPPRGLAMKWREAEKVYQLLGLMIRVQQRNQRKREVMRKMTEQERVAWLQKM